MPDEGRFSIEQLENVTGSLNNLALGADAHQTAASGNSVLDGVADVVTKGIPLTGLSIYNSFVNTGVDIANWFGADAKRNIAEDQLRDYDDDLLRYYVDKKDAIETSGLIVGSFIPGMAAIKVLKMAQAGKVGINLGSAMGLQPSLQRSTIQKAIDMALDPTKSAFGLIERDKMKAIALGFADQALQAAAFEVATYATMEANPILDKKDHMSIAADMLWGVGLGGVVGGAIEGWATRSLINKFLINADKRERPFDMKQLMGLGDFNEGDRVVALLNSLDNIPVASTAAQEVRKSRTMTAGVLEAKKILLKIAPDADNDLSNSFLDSILHMRNNLGMSKEEVFDKITRLSKIERVGTDAHIPSETSNMFFVNTFKNKDGIQSKDLTTNVPHENAHFSKRYAVADGYDVKTAHALTDADESISPGKFANKTQAFDAGYDMFLDAQLNLSVNPASKGMKQIPNRGESRVLTEAELISRKTSGQLPEGARPLFGAPVGESGRYIYNVIDGGVRDRVYPVVGDLAKQSEISVTDQGLRYGNRHSNQTLSQGYQYESGTAIDANARFVWAAKRGIQKNDLISERDLPVMEELLRKYQSLGSRDTIEEWINKQGIKFSDMDGGLIILTAEKMQQHVLELKQSIAVDLLAKGKMDADEIAQRINTKRSFVEDGFAAERPEDAFLPWEQHTKVNNVRLWYDIGNPSVQEGNIVRGLVDTQIRIKAGQQKADEAAANFFRDDFDKMKLTFSAGDADVIGAGAGAFSSADAKVGTLAQQTETIGAGTQLIVQKHNKETVRQLATHYQDIANDPTAGAELAILTNQGRRTSQEKYRFLDAADAQGILSVDQVADGYRVIGLRSMMDNKTFKWKADAVIPDGFMDWKQIQKAYEAGEPIKGQAQYYVVSPKVAGLLDTHTLLNDRRLVHHSNFRAAQGMDNNIELGNIYFPPINTNRYKHYALVREIQERGGSSSSVGMVVADSADGLKAKLDQLGPEYQHFFKENTKQYHQILGDYEYNANLSQNSVNEALARKGVLADLLPNLNPEDIAKEYLDWHLKQDTRMVRNFVELANAQTFAELRALGAANQELAGSKFGYTPPAMLKSGRDPFDSYIKTALGISEKSEYTLWNNINETSEAFFSTGFRKASEFLGKIRGGQMSLSEAEGLTKRYGLGSPYSDTLDGMQAWNAANRKALGPSLSNFVQTANQIVAGTVIRLDWWQTAINVISTPVLLASQALSARGELTAALKGAMTTALPDGSGRQIPAISKLMFQATADYFGPGNKALLEGYRNEGFVRGLSSDFYEMLGALTIPKSPTAQWLNENSKKAMDIAVKLTGSDRAEEFVRFLAARTAHIMYESAGYEGRVLTDNIRTFVNRVHGNYVASQRPIAFQGPIGQAIGLFQTYQFNMIQQMLRFVGEGQNKSLAMLGGLQGTLFGMQGLPGFQAINTHIVGNAAINPTHDDIYSGVPKYFGKELGDYLLYGVASGWTNTGIYTRGDISPRQISVLPINPLDWPSVSSGVRFVSNLLNVGEKLKDGGKWSDTLLQGMEHNGLSRPLAGLSQVVQGYTTTSQGTLLSAASDWASIATASRVLGSRPLDEAVALDANYRKTAYDAKDNARIQQLGEAVKSHLVGKGQLNPEQISDFAARYAAAGGNINSYNKMLVNWNKGANVSEANMIYQHLQKPSNQHMSTIMGGKQLPDFSNLPSIRASSSVVPEVE